MPVALPPGPPLPTAVQTALWFRQPIAFLEWCARRYGDVFTLRLALGPPTVLVSEPRLVEQVLALDAEAASTGDENAILAPLLGEHSVLMLDGPAHLRMRRLVLPLLHGDRLRQTAGTIAAIVRSEVGHWPLRRPFPLLPRMRDITFEVILRVVFGLDDTARRHEVGCALRRLLAMGSSWMVVPALQRDLGPYSPWGRFVRLKARLDALLLDEVRQRHEAPAASANTVIDVLRHDMDEAELVDTLMTLLVAGHETTATSLAWFFELTLRQPQLVERMRHELAIDTTRLLDATIRETLRIRPVFRYISRRLRKPLELGRYTIPPGVAVGANIYLAHRRRQSYDRPDVFDPDRFAASAPTRGAWIPFGGGVRRCLGASFAAYEMAMVIRTVLAIAELRPASARPEAVSVRAITLVPSRGARVVLESRVPAPAGGAAD